MHRQTLTLRRFGAMSFGLGYYEDGIWVDHSTSERTTTEALTDGNASPSDRLAMNAVHQWYTCCVDSTDRQSVIGIVGESRVGDITARLHAASSR